MSNTGDRKCFACSLIINNVSPMMWLDLECYHEKCARTKMELDNKINNMFCFHDVCNVCNCSFGPFELVTYDSNGKRIHPICPSLNDREKELYHFEDIQYAIPTLIKQSTETCKIEDIISIRPKRVSWKKYFIDLADLVSTRSTCDRKHVGCVIVRNNRIISTGYNGSGETEKEHCDDVGHFIVDNHCTRTVHAERNALKFCIDNKIDMKDCSIFVNTYPCWPCFGEIVKSGIKEIFYKDSYRNDELIEKVAQFLDIKIEKVV